jgi:opacity protein-like surface antigen
VSLQVPAPVDLPPRDAPRWLVQGIGGLTLGDTAGGFYAGGLGAHLNDRLLVIGEIGRLDDIAPSSLATEGTRLAASTAAFLSFVTGRTFQVASSVGMPATYGLVGVRVLGPPSGAARPYASGGIGFARLEPRVVLTSGADDVTFALLRPTDLPARETAGLVALGGGLMIRMAEGLSVDAGYRYARLTASTPVHVNRVYAALGYGF